MGQVLKVDFQKVVSQNQKVVSEPTSNPYPDRDSAKSSNYSSNYPPNYTGDGKQKINQTQNYDDRVLAEIRPLWGPFG